MINEAERNVKRASKLLRFLNKKHTKLHGDKYALYFKKRNPYPHSEVHAGSKWGFKPTVKNKNLYKKERKYIPIDSVDAGQAKVNVNKLKGLLNKAKEGRFKDEKTNLQVIAKPGGRNQAFDGHHTYFAQRLLGKSKVLANVYTKKTMNESFLKAWKLHWRKEKKEKNPFGYKRVRWPAYAALGSPTAVSLAGTAYNLATKNYPAAAAFAIGGAPSIIGNTTAMLPHIKDALKIRKKLKEQGKLQENNSLISFRKFLCESEKNTYQHWFIHFKYGFDRNIHESEETKEFYAGLKGEPANTYLGTKIPNDLHSSKQISKSLKAYFPGKAIKDLNIKSVVVPSSLPDPVGKIKTQNIVKKDERLATAHHNLSKHYQKLPSDNHESYLRDYTNSSSSLNKHLYQQAAGLSTYGEYDEKISHLDDIMRHHVTPHHIVVYSGLKRSPEQLIQSHSISHGPHFKIHLPAYTSTSLNREKAKSFAIGENTQSKYGDDYRHILSLKIPKGSHGTYAENHTTYQSEYEFILPRNSKIHISAKPKVEQNKRIVNWYGVLVNDGFEEKHHKIKSRQLHFFKKLLGKE